MEMLLLTPLSCWAHAPGCGGDLHLQILSSNRVIFLLQPSFKLFVKKEKGKALLCLALRFVQCKEVAFAGMKEEGIFKDYHKNLEELIIHGTQKRPSGKKEFSISADLVYCYCFVWWC